MMMQRKKIAWVTPDYFMDTDLNGGIIEGLTPFYDMDWIVLLPSANARFGPRDFERFRGMRGLTITFLYWTVRARDPRMLLFYHTVYKKIRAAKADYVYFNEVPSSPYIIPLYTRLDKQRTIFTAHDGSVKTSFRLPWVSNQVFRRTFGTAKNVHMYSPSQAKLFRANFPQARVTEIPLALKDFGISWVERRKDAVVFLFFGSIISNKNVGLLIEAAEQLYASGIRGFKVAIHGHCTDWSVYQQKIIHPEIFETDIRMHRNEEIPGLLSSSHYMVFPYKEMSQSGALKVAFRYGLPVLVSRLQGFTDEVEEGVNGFVFDNGSVTELAQLMETLTGEYSGQYEQQQQRAMEYNTAHYSPAALVNRYRDMFQALDQQ